MKYIVTIITVLILIFGCKKDKVPLPNLPAEPTKWEIICGTYKVYDSLGNYSYTMQISHTSGKNLEGILQDTLHFENFDGQFNFSRRQSDFGNGNVPKTYIQLGMLDTITGSGNKRWSIFGPVAENSNIVLNDSINLSFRKDNIKFWMSDLTPYYFANIRQLAVKQH